MSANRYLLNILIAFSALMLFGISMAEAAPRRNKLLTAEEAAALLDKAMAAVIAYNVDEAQEYLYEYDEALTRNKRLKPDEDKLNEISSQIVLTRNMLDRVEKIAVIDSVIVPKNDFFRYYKLSPEAGRLADASVLPKGVPIGHPGVVYVPENEIGLIWAAPDSVHSYHLMSADLLDDGKFTDPVPLKGELNDKGNANFPFMMPDGITLYYANSGSNSLGGYDIFMTRKDEDGFLQPQNMGMPYNSPYDDYLLAIDEITGAGWWATDRNQIADSVTIYIFVPNETRVNYSPEDPNVVKFAKLSDIAATRQPGKNYDSVLKAIASIQSSGSTRSSSDQFRFFIPGKGLYTSLDQFRTLKGRDAMEKYLAFRESIGRLTGRLQELRKQYADGNKDVSTDIVRIEKQLQAAPAEEDRLASEVVRCEQ